MRRNREAPGEVVDLRSYRATLVDEVDFEIHLRRKMRELSHKDRVLLDRWLSEKIPGFPLYNM